MSDRILIAGMCVFALGIWIGRFTADQPVFWGLLQ
jgi:hypothetical protein